MAGEYSIHLNSGLTVYAMVFDKDRAKVWNGSAFVALSSVAAANFAAGKIACPEQKTSDGTGTGIYVGDRPAGINQQGRYLVEFYNGVPVAGALNVGIQFDTVGVAPYSLAITDAQLKVEVADYAGFGRNKDDWSAEEEARLDAVVQSGVLQFFWPPPLGNERQGHRWSFLRPVAELPTVVGQGDYDLPNDFGGLVTGELYYSAEDGIWHPIRDIGPGAVLHMRSKNPSNAAPVCGAVIPQVHDGSAPQGWTLALVPAADAVYTVKYQYQIVPDSIGSPYNIGGTTHYETLLASCLAIAERRLREDDATGRQQAYWQERLAASIAYDRKQAPRYLGYNADRSGAKVALKRSNYVTFGGVLYDNR